MGVELILFMQMIEELYKKWHCFQLVDSQLKNNKAKIRLEVYLTECLLLRLYFTYIAK